MRPLRLLVLLLINFLTVLVLLASESHSFLIRSTSAALTTTTTTAAAAVNNNNPTRLHAAKNKFQPFTSKIMSNMAQNLFFKKSLEARPAVDQALASSLSALSSWSDIRSALERVMTTEERQFRSNLELGYGKGSPLHKIRLFDPSNTLENDVQVTLYRDSASWCPYCQKVWMALETKRIPYAVEKVNMRCYGDKTQEFLQLQPSGNIPVARIKGVVYGQSNDILDALEREFPHHKPLLPTAHLNNGDSQTARIQSLLKLERELFSAWMYWLTGSSSSSYKTMFVQVLDRVERELGASTTGPFFLGKDISLVDIMFAPFLERMAASLCYYKGFLIRVPPPEDTNTATTTNNNYPNINRWFDAMERLESYQLTKSDYYTHAWDLPPQLGGCTREPAGEALERAINTQYEQFPDDNPHLGGIEPDWTWITHEEARREAVERVTANCKAIVKFAARGAGQPGMPPVSAPLADPNAVPSEAVLGAVDAVMRIVCLAIMNGVETQNDVMTEAASLIVTKAGGGKNNNNHQDYVDGVVASLAYVRDRIGVPRDMTLPAARQLRSHLHWAITKLRKASQNNANQ